MMEEGQLEAIIEERIAAALAEFRPPSMTMMPVKPFDAWDDADHPVQVVGVSWLNDEMELVCITERDGEFFPTIVGAVYKVPPEG